MKAEILLLDSENKLHNDVNVASFCLAPFCLSDKEQDIPLVCTSVNRQQKKIRLWEILGVGSSIKYRI